MDRRLTALLAAIGLISLGLAGTSGFAQTKSEPAVELAVATFAGGCFWCVEADFDKIDGVTETISGFMGGTTKNPTYQQVVRGNTGHLEVVQIKYDPKKVSYESLVRAFFRSIDPFDDGGQFCDRGDTYRTAIFAHTEQQREIAERVKAALDKDGPEKKPLVTRILPASEFTAAEDYHQDFYKKSPGRYYSYRAGCGRDRRIEQIWGKKVTN